jgi:hypothetical protein
MLIFIDKEAVGKNDPPKSVELCLKHDYREHEVIRSDEGVEFLRVDDHLILDNYVVSSNWMDVRKKRSNRNYSKAAWRIKSGFVRNILQVLDVRNLVYFYTRLFKGDSEVDIINKLEFDDETFKKICHVVECEVLLNGCRKFIRDNKAFIMKNIQRSGGMRKGDQHSSIKGEGLAHSLNKSKSRDVSSVDNIFVGIKRLIRLKRRKAVDLSNPFGLKYKRLFWYKMEVLEAVGYRNLGYEIIGMNENLRPNYCELRESFTITRNNRNNEKIRRALDQYFGDTRVREVERLMDTHAVGCFEFDEDDLEGKRENSFMVRASACIGNGYLYFGCGNERDRHDIPPLVYGIKRNGAIKFESPSRFSDDWPEFHHTCSQYLALPLNENISVEILETHINKLENDGYGLAGMIYAFGIHGKLKDVPTDFLASSLRDKGMVVPFITMISMCISKMGTEDCSLSRVLIYHLETDCPYLLRIGSIMGLGFLYRGRERAHVENRIIVECNRRGVFNSSLHNKGNKVWYDDNYRIFSIFSLCLVKLCENGPKKFCKFVELEDSLCELIVNGILFFNSGERKVIKRLRRSEDSRLEEIFYSSLFMEGVTLERDVGDILSEIESGLSNCTSEMLYKYGGLVFYIALKSLVSGEKSIDRMRDRMIELSLELEILTRKDVKYKILFDTVLVSLSIMNVSTCDLDILRILRRQLSRTERSKFLGEINDFVLNYNGCKYETQYGIRYGDHLRYKMCIGMLCSGLSLFNLSADKFCILNIIASFYITFPLSVNDQDYLQIVRYFLLLSYEQDKVLIKGDDEARVCHKYRSPVSSDELMCDINGFKCFRDVIIKDRRDDINKYFEGKYSQMGWYDKKITIDIVSDYFERMGVDEKLGFDIFKKVMCHME